MSEELRNPKLHDFYNAIMKVGVPGYDRESFAVDSIHVEHSRGSIALSKSELTTLDTLAGAVARWRDIETLRADSPKEAKHIEDTLVPTGLVERDPTAVRGTIYRVTRFALKQVRYVAVLSEKPAAVKTEVSTV